MSIGLLKDRTEKSLSDAFDQRRGGLVLRTGIICSSADAFSALSIDARSIIYSQQKNQNTRYIKLPPKKKKKKKKNPTTVRTQNLP
jgi:hypothetical protein